MHERLKRRRRTLLLAAGVVASCLSLLAYALHVLRAPELQSVDARFTLRGERPAPRGIAVVAIDDLTFSELQQRFPFPRRLHAQLIDRLRAAGAKTIAFDIQFTEPTSVRDDNALINAIGRAPGMVLATTETGAGGTVNVLGGEEVLRSVKARAGNASLPADRDGVYRRMPCRVDGLKAFAVVVAEQVSGRPVRCPHTHDGSAPIDFSGPPGTIETFSYADVLRGRIPSGVLRGKAVIVGSSAPSLQDVHPTAAARRELMPGAEIQANSLSTLLRGQPLRDAPGWVSVALIALLGMALPVGSLRVRALRPLFLALALAAGYALLVYAAFRGGWIIPLTYPLLALLLATLGVLAATYTVEAVEREHVRDVFSRFVPETVVDDVLARAGENLRLGAVKCTATVMFSDLRGFTSFAETLPAEQVIEAINAYLETMSEAILDAGGTLIAYMGDGIMAVFGAPIPQDDHADRAVRTAAEMTGPRLAQFNAWLRERGHEGGFRMGVGLNTGPVMAGNVGSDQRMEYTAIGDTTNTAARLEGLTKNTPHMVLVADSTRNHLSGDVAAGLVDAGEVEVRGRGARLHVWSLTDAPASPPS